MPATQAARGESVATEPNEVTEQGARPGDGEPDGVSPDPLPAPSVTRSRSDRGRLHATRQNMLSPFHEK